MNNQNLLLNEIEKSPAEKALDNFSTAMLNSAINGINQAVAIKQQEVNYWRNRAKEKPLTNEQLLIMLGERIKAGQIKSDANRDYLYVTDQLFQKIITVAIQTGQIESGRGQKEVKHA